MLKLTCVQFCPQGVTCTVRDPQRGSADAADAISVSAKPATVTMRLCRPIVVIPGLQLDEAGPAAKDHRRQTAGFGRASPFRSRRWRGAIQLRFQRSQYRICQPGQVNEWPVNGLQCRLNYRRSAPFALLRRRSDRLLDVLRRIPAAADHVLGMAIVMLRKNDSIERR